ncbi:HAD family hydrolase [Marinactinospora rubrisoli]|uniref:HAD family hydrolase n=1 Tax=Marinactinospora rubrisoli TaxID=2715399 RepID=A0ABW2KL66_9ACTN
MDDLRSALRHRPDALLLDFGGVVFQTRKRPGGRAEMAARLQGVLARAGHTVDTGTLLASLDAGLAALKDWKNSAGRRLAPTELDHRTIWTDFLASDLDEAAREVLAGSAGALLAEMSPILSDHEVRPGVRDLLAAAAELGVRVGMVSNAHSGRAHRDLLDAAGLSGFFGVQVYSDEVGIRKPHPEMIRLAARALGTVAERCWYVGDTQDRDVVAGRRAGVAAAILTRHHHTDNPPYAVSVRADAVFDTPEGLVGPLRASVPVERPAAPPPGPRSTPAVPARPLPAALLLDHGGVISTSTPAPDARRAFAGEVAALLRRAGHAFSAEEVADAIATGRERYRDWKQAHAGNPVVPEISPREFWCDLVGRDWAPEVRALLHAESARLTLGYARSKSHAEPRPGVAEVLAFCADHGVPVAVVSNTLCGRAVRERLDRHGLTDRIGVHVYSDELGRRKPDPATVTTAITALGVPPAGCWFVGDKPWRDAAAARRGGIGTVVIVRGGSATDEEIAASRIGPAEQRPTHVIDEMSDLLDLWGAPPPTLPA